MFGFRFSVWRAAGGSPRVLLRVLLRVLGGTLLVVALAVRLWFVGLLICWFVVILRWDGPLTPDPSPPFHGGEGRIMLLSVPLQSGCYCTLSTVVGARGGLVSRGDFNGGV